LEELLAAMRPYFPVHEMTASSPDPRVMILFQRA
jgi:hypothetical protein